MKIAEIEVGGRYLARVSGIVTTVRVLGIRDVPPAWHGPSARWRTRIDVINERTGRRIAFASVARFRRSATGHGTGATGHPAPATPTPPTTGDGAGTGATTELPTGPAHGAD